jgi:P22 coat protein - gene protein 5
VANRQLNYSPQYWARQALMRLRNRRGMYPRVYRVFEEERKQYGLGDTINIRKPASFVAQNAPGSAAQDIKPGSAQVKIDIFREVKIGITDLETAFSGERYMTEHVGPMIDAIADDYESALYGLAAGVPHTYDFANATDVAKKFAAMRRIMVENKVPRGSEIHYMASPLTIERSIGAAEFSQAQGAGDRGIATQTTGEIGPKYGFNFFESTMNPVFEGDATLTTGATPTVAGTPLKNTSLISLNTGTAQSVELHKGQVIAITDSTTGITERYSITANTAASGNNWPNVPISPPLRRDLGASSVWAFVSTVGLVGSVPNYQSDLAFHRNAFAAVMVELPKHDGENMYTASDPDTGLTVRARVFYDGHAAQRYVVIDALGGVAVLDPDLALRPCSR